MTEYIEKQAARPDEFCVGVSCQECPFLKDPLYGGCRVDDFIMALPPADVRPVVRGKWVWRHRHRGGFRRVTGQDDFGITHTITIDERFEIDDPYCPFCKRLNESVFLNFCPNCGADMQGGDAE